jgi:Fe2+ or Zn2+ uptake regulation protein
MKIHKTTYQIKKQLQQSWKELKKRYGLIYICNGCGNILDSEGYNLDKAEMGNNYEYSRIGNKLYHYTICDKCKEVVLLGRV